MKKNISLAVILFLIISLTSCAHKVDVSKCLPYDNDLPSFWAGTWHGMISGFSFIGSLFDDDIVVYAVNNNGHWYDFGFVGGLFVIIRMISGLAK